ncbi:MAG TPA: acetate kinase [Candidatus Tectomicrobia bacterium]|nr:acetate kinase [Candidatus Tectomicrobia bacterium]
MNVLVFNCGSSSLKFQVIDVKGRAASGERHRRLARGLIERIGGQATCTFTTMDGGSSQETTDLPGHEEAVRKALHWLASVSVSEWDTPLLESLDAVGHRIVHGGAHFGASVRIDEAVLATLESINELAPLHNPPAVKAIRACRTVIGSALPMVAAFDTAFHQTLPDYASSYALPYDLSERHRIRRYGFHGLAHHYVALRYGELTGTPREQTTIITLHLGNGCSASAIQHGKSVDTSMGFTPLEGLVMGTRSGDLDPAVMSYLVHKEGIAVDEVETWLNTRSGLLGVSGRSNDMRELLEHYDRDARARLAVELFCYRARKYVGAYLAVLGGAAALVFSGGIGEHSPAIRAKICAGMGWCGLLVDAARNAALRGSEGQLSPADARMHAYVIPSDEEILIARDAAALLHAER